MHTPRPVPAHALASALAATLCAPLAAQAAWQRVWPVTGMQVLSGHRMEFHAGSGRVVLFGGSATTGFVNQFWFWDGAAWTFFGGARPPARGSHHMAYDAARDVVVLFGGQSSGGSLNDTWEWNGTSWTQRLPITSPSRRSLGAMTYDTARQRSVLFGGNDGNVVGDTWEWNGVNWQQMATGGPPARIVAAMADDRGHGVLLCGGSNQNVLIADCWRWNGIAWAELHPSMLPFARATAVMVTDTHRDRVVLHGGGDDPFTWEWDGVTWDQVFRATPGIRVNSAMAYDGARRDVVLFSGQNLLVADTWVRRTPLPADVTSLGNGCAGSAGVPVLDHVPGSLPWLGDRLRMQATSLGTASLAFFVTGTSLTPPIDLAPIGLPGCLSLVDIATFHAHAVAGGAAEWGVNLPNHPVLAGARAYQQVLAMDAGAPDGGSVSNVVELVLGVR
ncbi:MAG: hypothetical protein AB7O97_03320 [Planctomycetota bacterium]